MNTVVGIVADQLGHAHNPAQRRAFWSTPAAEFRTEQPAWIPVDRDHNHRWVGKIIYLERTAGGIVAVAEVDAEPTIAIGVGTDTVHLPTDLYFSAERVSTADDTDITLSSVALTHWPARIGARPLVWYPGDLAHRSSWTTDSTDRALLNRAGEARHRRGPLVIAGGQRQQILTRVNDTLHIDENGEAAPTSRRDQGWLDSRGTWHGELWHRPCGRILSIS